MNDAWTEMHFLLSLIFFRRFILLGIPDLSYGWAAYLLFHSNFSQILHTISISLTVTLAVWRYIAIK